VLETKTRIATFKEFWKVYVMAHQDQKNRLFHFFATLTSIVLGIAFLVWQKITLLILMPVAAYSLAWFGHLFHEKNKPLTWTYPIYSLIADYKMFLLICLGKMEREVVKVQATTSV